jgi:nucleoside-diphosphate-sugar epimerase
MVAYNRVLVTCGAGFIGSHIVDELLKRDLEVVEKFLRVFWEIYGLESVCLRYFNVYGPRQNCDIAFNTVESKQFSCKES